MTKQQESKSTTLKMTNSTSCVGGTTSTLSSSYTSYDTHSTFNGSSSSDEENGTHYYYATGIKQQKRKRQCPNQKHEYTSYDNNIKMSSSTSFSQSLFILCRFLCQMVLLMYVGFLLVGNTVMFKRCMSWWWTKISSFVLFSNNDLKSSIPTIVLTIPLLLVTCICCCLCVTTSRSKKQERQRSTIVLNVKRYFTVGGSSVDGDLDFHKIAKWFLLLPCSISVICAIQRRQQMTFVEWLHMTTTSDATVINWDVILKNIGNSFASTSLICFSLWLIPVTKHSILLQVLGWNPIHATTLHIWLSRCSTFGFMVHGLCHLLRNKTSLDFFYYLLTGIWSLLLLLLIFITSIKYIRQNYYRIFYICHIILSPCFLVVSILHWKRTIFYILPSLIYYIVATCPAMIERRRKRREMTITMQDKQHKEESVTSDEVSGTRHMNNPLKRICILPVRSNTTSGTQTKSCIVELSFYATSTTIDALMKQPCQYGRINVPTRMGEGSCSTLLQNEWHPFTVFVPPQLYFDHNHHHHLKEVRIMFRTRGTFTNQLAQSLKEFVVKLQTDKSDIEYGRRFVAKSTSPVGVSFSCSLSSFPILPLIMFDGFYGGRDCTNIIMAGGIGITPYLSLLPTLLQQQRSQPTTSKQIIVLHWMCRDEFLIQRVVEHYFIPILTHYNEGKNNISVKIVIHRTTRSQTKSVQEETTTKNNPSLDTERTSLLTTTTTRKEEPVVQSTDRVLRWSSSSSFTSSTTNEQQQQIKVQPSIMDLKSGRNIELCCNTSLISFGCLTIVWYLSREDTTNANNNKDIIMRNVMVGIQQIKALICMIGIGFIVPILIQWIKTSIFVKSSDDSSSHHRHHCQYFLKKMEQTRQTSNTTTSSSSNGSTTSTLFDLNDDYDDDSSTRITKECSREYYDNEQNMILQTLIGRPCIPKILQEAISNQTTTRSTTMNDTVKHYACDSDTSVTSRTIEYSSCSRHSQQRTRTTACSSVGIFTCGPSSMVSSIKTFVTKQQQKQNTTEVSVNIALYEEAFEP